MHVSEDERQEMGGNEEDTDEGERERERFIVLAERVHHKTRKNVVRCCETSTSRGAVFTQ